LFLEDFESLDRVADQHAVETAASDRGGSRIVLDSGHSSRRNAFLPGCAGTAGSATNVAEMPRVAREKLDQLGAVVIGRLFEQERPKTGIRPARLGLSEDPTNIVR